MQNIKNFLKLKGKSHSKKPFSGIKIILMNETKDEVSKFLNRWKDQGLDSIEVKYFNSWAGQLKETKILTQPKHCIANHIARDKKRQPCKWFWHNLVILWDGTVAPCCRDYDAKLVLGNIAKESLRDIWNSGKMLKLRNAQANLNFENGLCGTCPEWIGSRSNRFFPIDMSLYRGLKEYLGKTGIFKTGIDIASKNTFSDSKQLSE
jgi:radical SAM protein with 4Fe4S-binding SPASM domain